MDEFMKKLKAYIYANPPDFGDGDAESILEMIHWYYAECNPFHTQEIKDGFADLNDYMEGLPIKDNDAVFSLYVASIAMDAVVYGSVNAKIAYIISERSEEITGKLMNMKLGATILDGHGAFSGNTKNVLLCAAKPAKIARIKTAIVEVDPNAFIIVSDAKEVYGEGFAIFNEDSL